ncbi:MAG: substrate-binding domain-containing protein [Chloroflexota bacterium]
MKRILFLLGLCLTACTPTLIATPPSTPQPLRVSYHPLLEPVTEALNACARSHTEFIILTNISLIPNSEKADLILWLGAIPQQFVSSHTDSSTTPLAWERIHIIIHPSNPLTSLTLEELKLLYSGRVSNWDEFTDYDQPVSVWTYPSDNLLGAFFEETFLHPVVITSLGWLAFTPEAMHSGIASDPGAIGYTLHSWLTPDQKVKTVQLSVDEATMRLPVLAFTATKPTGALYTLIACLQSGAGQDSLLEAYLPWE